MSDKVKPLKAKPKSKQPAQKKPNRIGKFYGGTAGWKGIRTKPAKQIVDSQIRQETEEIRDQARQVRSTYKDNESGINNIYNSAEQYLGQKNAETQGAYDQASQQNSLAQESLRKQLLASGAQSAANVSSELSRLGITDVGALNALTSGSQNALNVAAQTAANDEANLNARRAGAVSIGNLLLGNNSGARTQAFNENMNDYRDAQAEIDDALRDARGARGDLLIQLLEQMKQTGWGQHMDQQNLNLQRQQFAWQKQQAKLAARAAASSGGGSGSSSGSSIADLLAGGTPKTPASVSNPWGPGPMPEGWGQGLGVLSNKVPPKPKPVTYGRGLGVKVKPGKQPKTQPKIDLTPFLYD